jgi:hypothetical protein
MAGPIRSLCLGAVLLVAGSASAAPAADADDLLIVDCALPGQIRQLGRATTYVAPRRPERTTALDCRIRGGEYVVRDRASLRTSLAVWLEQARSGDPEAQTIVGELFERGLASTPDYAAAAEWYRRAAEAEFPRAQVNLGHLYEKGLGVPRDPQQALGWYRRAAGLPDAIELESIPDVAPLIAARDRAIAELEAQVRSLERESAELRDELERLRASLDEARRRTEDGAVRDARAEELARELDRAMALLMDRESELARRTEEAEALLAAQRAARQESIPAEPSVAALQTGALAGPDIVLIEPVLGATRGLVRVSIPAPARRAYSPCRSTAT